jgi:hypothetical protein
MSCKKKLPLQGLILTTRGFTSAAVRTSVSLSFQDGTSQPNPRSAMTEPIPARRANS